MVKTYNCSCNRNMYLGDAATIINKDCRVLFGDIFIVSFLSSALAYLKAMCSPGWGNLVAFDWNDLLVGREFDGKFLKNVKSPPHALPPLRRLYIDRCITFGQEYALSAMGKNLPAKSKQEVGQGIMNLLHK